jgi:hypothetical protein
MSSLRRFQAESLVSSIEWPDNQLHQIISRKTYDPADGSMGYMEIAFCKMSRGGSTGDRASKRAATAVSLLMTEGVNRVPLDISRRLDNLTEDLLVLDVTRDERDSSEFTLLQQGVRRRRD